MSKFRINQLSAAISSVLGLAIATPVFAQDDGLLEEIIVTAQRKAESIQDVPIAVSAFGSEDLQLRRIDDGRDLQLAVPNLTFTGGNNFQIRGVGDSVGGTTGDVGVGIHRNNAPQVVSRIVTAETYDMERVEVLRGPQGTLYGRNSTGGVINFITAKPTFGENEFSLGAEFGNYGNRKLKGMANIPLGDLFAFRLAGSFLQRDGYTKNLATGNDIDDRDLYSVRATFAFEPTDFISGWILYEKFSEDDHRRSGASNACIMDPGPTQVGSTAITDSDVQAFLSQGCAPGSIYSDSARSFSHSVGTFGGRFARYAEILSGVDILPDGTSGNLFAGQAAPTDLRTVLEYFDPQATIDQEIIELEVKFNLTDALTLSLLGHTSEDESYLRSGSYESSIQFNDTPFTPGGVYTDFQNGAATGMRTLSIGDSYADQTSIELRLESDFDGPINFNLGFLDFSVERETHTFVSTNTTTLFVSSISCAGVVSGCNVYFDQNATPDYTGHQYFDTWTPYQLDSQAIFAEGYFDISDTLKLTAGVRLTEDEKERLNAPVLLLTTVGEGGVVGAPGYNEANLRVNTVDFKETTGRVVLDWMPEVDFADSFLLYGSLARGYKSGGFNSPEAAGISTFTPYRPELVNAFELGSKGLYSGGRTQFNATFFYYDYQDYQISKIEQFSARNENVDAEVYGLEIESMFEIVDGLSLSANVGWLKSEITKGASVDTLNRTAGDPNFTVLKGYQDGCVAPTATVEAMVNLIQSNPAVPATLIFNPCTDNPTNPNDAASIFNGGESFASGVEQDLAGNALPNSPELSATIGLQYENEVGDWLGIFRMDYSWKDDSYASYFNDVNYELRSWDNMNLSYTMSNFVSGVGVQLFIKNVFDDDTIVNYATQGDGVGLVRGLTLLDPRLVGMAFTLDF